MPLPAIILAAASDCQASKPRQGRFTLAERLIDHRPDLRSFPVMRDARRLRDFEIGRQHDEGRQCEQNRQKRIPIEFQEEIEIPHDNPLYGWNLP